MRVGSFARFGTQQMILLLELLQPTITVDFEVAVRTSYSSGEKTRLVANNAVVQWQALTLVVSGPVG